MSQISIRTDNSSCTIESCTTRVRRDRPVVFALENASDRLDLVRVRVPGNILRRNGEGVSEFTLTPADSRAEFTVAGTAARSAQPINVVAQYAGGRAINGACTETGEQIGASPLQSVTGGPTGSQPSAAGGPAGSPTSAAGGPTGSPTSEAGGPASSRMSGPGAGLEDASMTPLSSSTTQSTVRSSPCMIVE